MELEDEADMDVAKARAFSVAGARQLLAKHAVLAFRRTQQRAQDRQQRALAGARGPEQRRHLPAVEIEVDPAQHRRCRLAFTENFGQSAHADQRLLAHAPIASTGSIRAPRRADPLGASPAPSVVTRT